MGRLVRIWRNTKTGNLVNYKADEDCVSTNLVYDQETRIVYYKFSEMVTVYSNTFEEQEPFDTKVGYMSPYINDRGKLCRYTTQIIEIN